MKKCFASAAVLVLIVGIWTPPIQAQKKEKKESLFSDLISTHQAFLATIYLYVARCLVIILSD